MPPDTPGSPEQIPHQLPPPIAAALRDRYEIIRETGNGGSATVYLARDLKHQRLVALKMLNPDVGHTAGARFLREIQVSAGMQHPHILPMYDSGVVEGRLYFVMPFVDGGSLRDRLEAMTQLPVDEALRYAHDVAIALAFAHDQGVVHRDVKPENILFYHGQACLADFGIARVVEQLDMRVTAHDTVVGTPLYMSPEQMAHGGFDARSDVYSLALVLYESITGVTAFSGATPAELLRQRLRTTPPAISVHRPDVPPVVDALLARALAPKPDQRFDDARQFAAAIERAQREIAQPPRRRSDPRQVLRDVPRRNIAWSAVLVLVIAATLLAWAPLRRGLLAGRTPFGDGDALAAGRTALSEWRLEDAEHLLTRAAATDPPSAAARLWLAETMALERHASTEAFHLATARLAAVRASLSGRDSLLAEGLIALGERDFPHACSTYDKLRATDSLDVLAWYGLGDCLSMDDAVVADSHSPSHWRFRTSWPAAARAYMRAVTIEPSSHTGVPYALFANLLPTDPTFIRVGRSSGTTSHAFAAYASIAGDSVVYVPWPMEDVTAGLPRTLSATLPDVMRRNRDQLLQFARQWTTAAPASADAWEGLALAREARGELSSDDDGAEGALRHARALSRSREQQVRLAASSVRLELKNGRFDAARSEAESVLAAWAHPAHPAQPLAYAIADRLAGLAALTGHVDETARYGAAAAESENADAGIAPPVTAAVAQLFARAAFGICDDSLLDTRGRVYTLLDSYTQPSKRESTRSNLLYHAAELTYPCLGARAYDGLAPVMPLDRAHIAAANHDARRARAILDSLTALRAAYRPGDISLDNTLLEASLYAALGDTATALHRLDLVLDALPTLGMFSVRETAQAAAVGRAFAYDAELAWRQGDRDRARQRAAAALALWQHADPALGATIARLRSLRPAQH